MAVQITISITATVQLSMTSTLWANHFPNPDSVARQHWWIQNVLIPNTSELDSSLKGIGSYLTSYVLQDVWMSTSYDTFATALQRGMNRALTEVEHLSNTSQNRKNAFLIVLFGKLLIKYVTQAAPWGLITGNLIPSDSLAAWERRAHAIIIGPDPVQN